MSDDDASIDCLPLLPPRARHVLEHEGITTIGQVRRLSDRELLRFRSFGRKSLKELRCELARYDAERAGPEVVEVQPEVFAARLRKIAAHLEAAARLLDEQAEDARMVGDRRPVVVLRVA